LPLFDQLTFSANPFMEILRVALPHLPLGQGNTGIFF